MYEYHVDVHPAFENFVSAHGKRYGGDLPYDLNYCLKPVLFIGQDESSLDSNTFKSSTWYDPDGKGTLRPKGGGYAIMISGFVSRELGVGLGINDNELSLINRKREEDSYRISMCAE